MPRIDCGYYMRQAYIKQFVWKVTEEEKGEYCTEDLLSDIDDWWFDLPRDTRARTPLPNIYLPHGKTSLREDGVIWIRTRRNVIAEGHEDLSEIEADKIIKRRFLEAMGEDFDENQMVFFTKSSSKLVIIPDTINISPSSPSPKMPRIDCGYYMQQAYIKTFVFKVAEDEEEEEEEREYCTEGLLWDIKDWWFTLPRDIRARTPLPHIYLPHGKTSLREDGVIWIRTRRNVIAEGHEDLSEIEADKIIKRRFLEAIGEGFDENQMVFFTKSSSKLVSIPDTINM